MNEDTKKDIEPAYLIKLVMVMRYKGSEMPDDAHVITPLRKFFRKTLNAYKGKYEFIAYKDICSEEALELNESDG